MVANPGGISGPIGQGKGRTPSASEELEDISRERAQLIDPILETSAGQVGDIVRSGGTGAFIPAIRQAVRAALSGSSQAQTETGENLTRAGITGTDRETILANLGLRGEQEAAAIPSRFALPVIQQAMAAVLGLPQLSVQGLGAAGGAQSGVEQARIAAEAQVISAALGIVPF